VFEVASVHFKADGSALNVILSNTSEYVGINCCHICLKSCHDLRYSWEGLHKRDPSDVPTGKNPSELDPATEEALDVQPTFLVKSVQPLPDIFPTLRWSSVVLKPQHLPHS
jgi:hypothetical protein